MVLLSSRDGSLSHVRVDDHRRIFQLEEHVSSDRDVVELPAESDSDRVGVVSDDVALKCLTSMLQSCVRRWKCRKDVEFLDVLRSRYDVRHRRIRINDCESIVQVEPSFRLLSELV